MKKKWMLGLGLVLAGLVIGTTAFALTLENDGYQVYKAALKNTWVAQSLTATAGVSVTNDGYPLLNSRDMVKMNLGSKDMSGYFIVSAGGQDVVAEIYKNAGQAVTRIDGSNPININGTGSAAGKYKAEYNKLKANANEVEKVVDLLTLKLQNSMTINNNPDGTKDVSLQVIGNQISEAENAIVSLLLKSTNTQLKEGPVANLINSMPKLVDDIKVNGIDFQAKINADDLIAQQTVNIAISGNDASGNSHDLMLGIDLNLSEFNNTVPDTVK